MSLVHISMGGPDRQISVGGKIYTFEDHPFCGPTLLNKGGDPIDLKDHPQDFLEAASLWVQQGRRTENGLCVWYHPAEPIVEHIGGRHYRYVGETEPRPGS